MNFHTVIPARYADTSSRYTYKFINVFEIYEDYIKLLIVEKLNEKTIATILLEKDDFDIVSQHHWGGTNGWRPPCASIDSKSVTLGHFISGSNFRTCGKIKGKSVWDFRENKYSETGNEYVYVDEDKMNLNVYRRKGPPYSVLFDKEDYPLLAKYIWKVEQDSKEAYSVTSLDEDKKQISMHIYILKSHGQKPGNKGFRNVKYKDYQFDFRKTTLQKKHALNLYTILNPTTVELTINSVHGVIKVIFDKKDYEKVSSIGWIYKRNGDAWVIRNYKKGLLKHFIVDSADKKFRFIDEKKDELNRFDFRQKTLLTCLR